MSENIRALIVILVLTIPFLIVAGRHTQAVIDVEDFTRRRNLWLAFTLVSFLSLNYWIFICVAIPLLLYANRHDSNPVAMFFFLLFALPMESFEIPAFGLLQNLFYINYSRLLVLAILLPLYISIRRTNDYLPFGRTIIDKILLVSLLLTTIVYFRDSITPTDALRSSFYLFLDVFLPYVVFSRSVKNQHAFRDVLMSFIVAIMILALIASVEFVKHWLLYDPVIVAIQGEGERTKYLGREGMLRVIASTSQPIVLGYLMMAGMGLYLCMQKAIKNNMMRRLGLFLLIIGLIVPLSRGPWLGAALMLFVYIATGRRAIPRLFLMGMASVFLMTSLYTLPGGEKIINLLPFLGSTEEENIDYRQQLITNSIIVIKRNPLFGSGNFAETPEMEAMRQGQGIIDITNHYLGITLRFGLAGLGLFVGFFAAIILGIRRTMRSIPDKDSEEYILGRSLLATLLAILFTLTTVSSIYFIPIVYWTFAGLGVAYIQMIRNKSALEQ